jgi:ribosomal protein S27AE
MKMISCCKSEQGSLLAAIYERFLMVNHILRYYCVECGSELFSKTSTRGLKTLLRSQECPSCGYTLLFGAVKKKT